MDRIGSLLARPKAYNNIDGVGELGIGVMCLGFAWIMWLQVHTPHDSVWHSMAILFFFALAAFIHYGSKAIKQRITYPRTGFVEYPARHRVWRPAILGAVVAFVIAVAIAKAARSHWDLTTPASLVGLLFAATYAYGFARTVRWKWIVAAVVACGAVVIAFLPAAAVAPLGDGVGGPSPFSPTAVGAYLLSFMLYGAVSMISGAISFWLYLRHTQAPSQEAV